MEDLRREGGHDETSERISNDWRTAELSERESALCAYGDKLTRTPAKMTQEDHEPLRAFGMTDRDIHDATQVVAYFNYINRIADALGTDLEPEMPPRP